MLRRATTAPPARWYLTSRTLCFTGDSVIAALFPLLVVILFGGGPGEVALVLLSRQLVHLVGSFPLAAWLDRRGDRVGIQLWALVAMAAVVGAAPLLWLFGALTFPALLTIATLVFVCDTVVGTSGYGLINQVTDPGARVEFTGRLASARSAGDITGQSLGPALLKVLPGPVALLAGACLVVVSAAALVPVRRRLRLTGPGGPCPAAAETVSDGSEESRWRLVLHHARDTFHSARRVGAVVGRQPDVLVMWAAAGGCSLTAPVLVVYAVEVLGLSVEAFGFLTAAGAVGGIVGGLAVGRLTGRVGVLRALGLSILLAAAAVPVLALGELLPYVRALAYAGVAGYEGLTAFTATVVIAAVFGRLQESTAESELSQTMSVARLGLDGSIIAALAVGGSVGSLVGVHEVLVSSCVALLALGALVWAAASSRRP